MTGCQGEYPIMQSIDSSMIGDLGCWSMLSYRGPSLDRFEVCESSLFTLWNKSPIPCLAAETGRSYSVTKCSVRHLWGHHSAKEHGKEQDGSLRRRSRRPCSRCSHFCSTFCCRLGLLTGLLLSELSFPSANCIVQCRLFHIFSQLHDCLLSKLFLSCN